MHARTRAQIAVLLLALPHAVVAQSDEQVSRANNPLADANSLNFQNLFGAPVVGIGGITNTMNLRGVMVRGTHLIRATLPLITVPTGDEAYESGLGDINIFDAIRLTDPDHPFQFGVGPMLVIPSATRDAIGSGKWQAGAAVVALVVIPGGTVLGALFTYQVNFAGDEDRPNTSLLTVQPIATIGIGNGWYIRSSALWLVDFAQDRYLVPFGIGFGKVIPLGGTVVNAFLEPQFAAYERGTGFPIFQLFAGMNLQWASR